MEFCTESAVGICCVHFNYMEDCHSLAILNRREIAHLGALKFAQSCGETVKTAAATAENRTILVHSCRNHFWEINLSFSSFKCRVPKGQIWLAAIMP